MIKAVLLDIEGTTTPIDFVHRTLFPFAKERLGEFVETNFDELQTELEQLGKEYQRDFTNQIYGRAFHLNEPETIVNYLQFLIDVDRKSTPLKALQGRIWQAGYESGELEGQVFADVPRTFERWTHEGKKIAIFSSGSVLAQKLIFKHSSHGSLSSFISAYFDTNIGAKKEAESYRRIARELRFEPSEITFVSDIVTELDAAREAELQTFLSIREGNAVVRQPIYHDAIASLNDLPV